MWLIGSGMPTPESIVALLQYEPRTKFFNWAVPELFSIKTHKIPALPRGVSEGFAKEWVVLH